MDRLLLIGIYLLIYSDNKMEFVMTYADYKCNKQLE
jgi:hypothetical protein